MPFLIPWSMKLFYPGHPAELKVDDAQKNAVSSWSLRTVISYSHVIIFFTLTDTKYIACMPLIYCRSTDKCAKSIESIDIKVVFAV